MVTLGRIRFMTRKELSAVVTECAARTERAHSLIAESVARGEKARADIEVSRAGIEASRAGIEAARKQQEAAIVRFEKGLAEAKERNRKLDALLEEMRSDRARAEVEREDEKRWREEFLRRQEEMFQHYLKRADETLAQTKQQTAEIISELQDQRDERRALKEAILKLIDRLPPPPPSLRSA
jgi:chromosome segregation ATPase